MKALIIDDESKSRNLLRTILQDYCSEITSICEAKDLPSGVKTIHKENPQIVFLDIEMPGYLGTQIMDFFDPNSINFQVIFTTAYSEYAIKAFEINAIAYLLKPMRPQKVCSAVQKALGLSNHLQINLQLTELKKSIANFKFGKIGLPISDGVLYVKLSEILFLKAEGMYTRFYTYSHDNLLISKPLKHFVQLLKGNHAFFRTHRSYLINIKHIKQLVKKDGTYLLMDNNATVAVSKEKQAELLKLLQEIF
ncbi:MAG: LytR/AlgR family response regulator transcription factor [Chitinophagales bacterium]